MKVVIRISIATMIVALSACGQGPAEQYLLRIGETTFNVEDFSEYLHSSRPTQQPPYDKAVLSRYLEEFEEHNILYVAAVNNQTEASPGSSRFEREINAIDTYLYQEAYRNVRIDDNTILEEYERRFTEDRVEIKSIFFENERTARNEYNRLRQRPRDFDDAMEKYNPVEVKEREIGQGIFTRHQLPKSVMDAVFAEDEPGIIGPIDVDNGYLVIRIMQFLGRTNIDDVRVELEGHVAARERYRLRAELVSRLKEELDVEFYPDTVLESVEFVKTGTTGEQQ